MRSIFRLGGVNGLLLAAGVLSLLFTTAVCELPPLAAAFEFTRVSLEQYGIAIGLGLCVIPVVELVKVFQRAAEKRRK